MADSWMDHDFEDEGDPFDTGGFATVDVVDDLGFVLEFADGAERRCEIAAASLLEAFLALECDGFIPEVGDAWRAAIARGVFEADRFTERAPARFKEMRYFDYAMCPNCCAEGHGVFEGVGETYLIERSTIVSAVLSLIEISALRPLPSSWTYNLRVAHEQICETWRHTRANREGGPCDV